MGGHIFLKISNIIAYFVFAGFHLKAILTFNEYDDPRNEEGYTYLCLAPFVFYTILTLLHIQFLGFIIYQFFPKANETVAHGVSWHFVAISILNSAFLILSIKGYFILAFLVAILFASQVSVAYFSVRTKFPAENWADGLLIHAPLSIFHGWIVVETIVAANMAILPRPTGGDEIEAWIKFAVWFSIIFLQLTAVGYIDVQGKGDVLGSLVIAFSLFGIGYQQQEYNWVSWPAYLLSFFTFIYSFSPFVKNWYRRRAIEGSTPLLG
ncbi:hypothetical protein G9A89_002628 [Geosiphon pyriformis]|nr:hypothetical protein G9A89_002628 [Geosiphon pyriformis]